MFFSTCASSLAYWEELVQQMFGSLVFWQSLVSIHLQSVASSVERVSGDSFTTNSLKPCVLSSVDYTYVARFLKDPEKNAILYGVKNPLGFSPEEYA